MKSKLIVIYLLGYVPFHGFCQAPAWLDESNRNKEYASEYYLTGFLKEIKVTESERVIERLKELVKSELIESIQVSIQSKSELKEQESMNRFSESFVFETSVFSEADIYGLETRTYYDKKSKSAYAFAYVSREDLIRYNKTVISVGFSSNEISFKNITEKIKEENLDLAVDELFIAAEELKRIKKAESILMALGITDRLVLRTDQYQLDRNRFSDAVNLVLHHPHLRAETLVSYFAKSMNQSLTDNKNIRIFIGSFRFGDFAFESEFSSSLKQYFSSEFSKIKALSIASDSISADYILSGTFSDVNKDLNIIAALKQKKGTTRRWTGSIKVESLKGLNLKYLPKPIEKFRLANTINLSSDLKNISLKCNIQKIGLPFRI